MLRRACLTVLAVVLLPATVQAFDHHHHHHHHHSDGDDDDAQGCSSDSEDDDHHAGADAGTTGTLPPAPTMAPAPSPTPAPGTSPALRKHVFITSTSYSGALGSLDAADMYCQVSATSGGLSGKYKAWLSGPATNAFDRIEDVGPWFSTHDVQVFGSKADLRGSPQSEIEDETGEQAVLLHGIWTGSDAQGNATVDTCNAWTDATPSASATTATGASGDPMWGGGNAPLSCDSHASLLCFEQ